MFRDRAVLKNFRKLENFMRLIVTGGGSGGHIYPAIAIADKIKEMEPDSEILYIGNEVGLENEIVPKAGYNIKLVDSMWLDRSNPLQMFKTAFVNYRGVRQALKIMKKFKPDVVVGTGGFVCVPVVIAGSRYGARCYIHEQNAYPGMANRLLERNVKKVFMGFPEAGNYFKYPEKHITAGNPVRKSFYQADRAEARRKLGIAEKDFVIFTFGGSQGAQTINSLAFDILKKYNGEEGVLQIFGTGNFQKETLEEMAEKAGIKIQSNVWIKTYIENMPDYLAASDVIISRAGALSVAEITMCGRASILIPSPNVTGNHQYFNAKSVADKGGAILVEEKDINPEEIIAKLEELRENGEELAEIMKASYACAPVHATDIIYAEIKKDER